jgi:hypothetical protein
MFRKIEKRTAATQAEGGKLEGKEEYESFLIKRKLISMEIKIKAKGQYETFSQKLPFNAQKVVGVAVCSSISDSKEPTMQDRCYFGVGPGRQSSEDFIKSLDSDFILSDRMVLRIQPNERTHHTEDDDEEEGEHDHNDWTYYTQPKRLGNPSIKMGGRTIESRSPVTTSILDDQTGIREDYYIWKSQEDNHKELEIEIIQQQLQP